MATKKVWNLGFVAGNPEMFTKVVMAAENPQSRADAMEAAKRLGDNGWRSWVEHAYTGRRIYESHAEATYRSKA